MRGISKKFTEDMQVAGDSEKFTGNMQVAGGSEKITGNMQVVEISENKAQNKHGKSCVFAMVLLTVALFVSACSSDAKRFYENGLKCMDNKSYEQAASYFKEAIKYQDDKAEYYIAYGMALLASNDYENAKGALKKAVVEKDNSIVKVNNKLAFRGLGMCLIKTGEYDEAEEYLKKAIDINAQNELDLELYCILTDAYMMQDKNDEAIKALDAAISEKEDDVLYGKRALLYLESGEFERAISDYEAMKDKSSTSNILGRYQAYTSLGQSENAKKVLEEALNKEPSGNKEKYDYARILYYSGDDLNSLGYFEEICNDYPESYYYMGMIFQKQNDYGNACSSYEDYINQCSDHVDEVYLALGSCFELREQFDRALEVLNTGYGRVGFKEKKKIAYRIVQIHEMNADFDSAYFFANNYMKEYPDDAAMEKELKFLKTRTTEFAEEHGKKTDSDTTSVENTDATE